MNPAVDISTQVPTVVTNTKLRCGPPDRHPGGGGINVSRAVKKLGGVSTAVFPAGGKTGEYISDFLADEEIETSPYSIEGNVRENFTVYEAATGEQYRCGLPGPTVADDEWQAILSHTAELCRNADYLVASGSLPPGVPTDFYTRLGRTASERDTRFVLDTSGKALGEASREEVFLMKPNRRELGHILGVDDTWNEDARNKDTDELSQLASEALRSSHVENLVVSLGREGAILVTRDAVSRLFAPEVKIRSKIGAGDSMTAGIVLSLARGESLESAFRFGIASGTAAVMTPGTELCRREDAERLAEEVRAA
jgi:6-phosphofructokinase 2